MLTRELARACRRLVAVELDERLCDALRAEFSGVGHVNVVHGDFLTFPLPGTTYKIFANLPYVKTAEMIRHITQAPVPPEDAYCVVQKEAAERFAGSPYAPETLPSLLLKPWWQIEVSYRLRRVDFDPPPNVDSVMLWLARRARPLVDASHGRLYHDFITASFGRGQTIRQCLRGVFTGQQILRLTRDLRFDTAAYPSDLTFDQWLGLFRYFLIDRDMSSRSRRAGR